MLLIIVRRLRAQRQPAPGSPAEGRGINNPIYAEPQYDTVTGDENSNTFTTVPDDPRYDKVPGKPGHHIYRLLAGRMPSDD